MLAKRIIPCMDVTAGRVVKGVNFLELRDAGDPVEIAKRYDDQGADELTFLDITATSDDRDLILHIIEDVASQVFIPLTVGGGVREVEDVRRLLNAGADKVSINTTAVFNPQMVAVLYRWQVFFYQHHLRFIASLLKLISNIGFTVIIDSETEIGPGLLIYHSSYIFIGPHVTIGSNCHLANQNTIMASPYYHADARKEIQGPVIGDGLLMGCGASIVGDIILGDDVKISVNSTVDASFPDGAVLIGVPAINIRQSNVE